MIDPKLLGTALLVLGASSCGSGGGGGTTAPPANDGPGATLDALDTSGGTDGIVDLPASVDARIRAVFGRYSQITAPNGQRIHFLAQPGVEDTLLFRARGMVNQHLFDVEGTTLGADKSGLRSAMAANDVAVAVIAHPSSFDPQDADVAAFLDLFDGVVGTVDASQMAMEASGTYLLPSPAIDPSLGNTAVLVKRLGLDVTTPDFATTLATVAEDAALAGRWRPASASTAEDYLALIVDVYYGIWGHDPRGDGTAGASGEYDFHLRSQMELGDPAAVALIESFFAPTHRYPAFLDASFDGTFEMAFDPVLPYTHRSRYLERAGLRGTATARINGNELDNLFVGNGEGTVFEGRGGNDGMDTGAGLDVLVLSGPMSEYLITTPSIGVTRIEDTVMNRDGIDDLRGVTRLEFSDGSLDL